MRIVIDTNRYRDFCESTPGVLRIFQRAERIAVPFVVLAELRAGFMAGSKSQENEKVLNSFLNRSRVVVLFPEEQKNKNCYYSNDNNKRIVHKESNRAGNSTGNSKKK